MEPKTPPAHDIPNPGTEDEIDRLGEGLDVRDGPIGSGLPTDPDKDEAADDLAGLLPIDTLRVEPA